MKMQDGKREADANGKLKILSYTIPQVIIHWAQKEQPTLPASEFVSFSSDAEI